MTVSRLRPYLWCLAVILALGASCRDFREPNGGPTPVVRASEAYTCANEMDGCRVTYRIGPVNEMSGTIRVHFTVALDGPRGGTTQWTNDSSFHDYLKEQGEPGIVLMLGSDNRVIYELADVGGIASVDEMLVAPVTYEGYWDFVVPEPAGSLLLLTYPDFAPAPIVVPE